MKNNKNICSLMAAFIVSLCPHVALSASVWHQDDNTDETYNQFNYNHKSSSTIDKNTKTKNSNFRPYGQLGFSTGFGSKPGFKDHNGDSIEGFNEYDTNKLFAASANIDLAVGVHIVSMKSQRANILSGLEVKSSLITTGVAESVHHIPEVHDEKSTTFAALVDVSVKIGAVISSGKIKTLERFDILPYASLGTSIMAGADDAYFFSGVTGLYTAFGSRWQMKKKPIGFYTEMGNSYYGNVIAYESYDLTEDPQDGELEETFLEPNEQSGGVFLSVFNNNIFRIAGGVSFGW